ncbi:unnamed protein product [Anisakis simplex]|uniref:Uncharacterized protein n=1 Tax=Anisakis simplex TaxID=6269 RepID=A0A0M3K588_ANISI|nr:unnamed protein product [Anisakis simplex]
MLFKHSLCSSSGHILNGNANEIICMPYDEVQKITKVHCMTPWPGRAIEVRLESKRKPLQFVGITKRDEFFDTVIELASQAGVNLSFS